MSIYEDACELRNANTINDDLNSYASYEDICRNIKRQREGFVIVICPSCTSDKWFRTKKTKAKEVYKCARCSHQITITGDDLKRRKTEKIREGKDVKED